MGGEVDDLLWINHQLHWDSTFIYSYVGLYGKHKDPLVNHNFLIKIAIIFWGIASLSDRSTWRLFRIRGAGWLTA